MSEIILEGLPDTEYLPDKSLGGVFYDEIRKWNPNRTVIIDSTDEEISYGQFLKLTLKLAKKFLDEGLKKGDVVTIITHNQWKYVATTVAAFYVGVTVNLLNPDYTTGELTHFFRLCQPKICFCTRKVKGKVLALKEKSFYPRLLIIYDEEEDSEPQETRNFDEWVDGAEYDRNLLPVDLDPRKEVALILTSSGTTGFPKCVATTHSGLRATLSFVKDPFLVSMQEEDVIQFVPGFHIFGLAISLATVLFGARLILLEKFVPDRFLSLIQEHKVAKLFLVPPILLFLVKSPLVQKYDLSSVNDIICGAAAITKELQEAVKERLGVATLRQVYGLTETTGGATMVPKGVVKYGTIGVLVNMLSAKVCNPETGKSLSANEVGELRFKGVALMKGYVGNSKATEEAFDEQGFLKSGDLGYFDEDGYFYIVGRLKEIIKYKGFQVSPVELEHLLMQHPSVKDAAVVGKPDQRSGEVPVAFVVKQPKVEVTEEELCAFVAEHLSVQKHLYGGVRFVDEIPKNPSGKILRRELQELL